MQTPETKSALLVCNACCMATPHAYAATRQVTDILVVKAFGQPDRQRVEPAVEFDFSCGGCASIRVFGKEASRGR